MWRWWLICRAIRLISWSRAGYVKRLQALLKYLLERVGEESDSWVTVRQHRKFPVIAPAITTTTRHRAAMVIQGPLRTDDQFTTTTLAMYRQTIPGVELILSTWPDASTEALDQARRLGAHVVISDPPENPGPYNLNHQIRSTRAGLEYARRLGHRWAIKTRTDTRCDALQFTDMIFEQLATLPPVWAGQRSRIAILDLVTRKFVPSHPSDILMAGDLEELLRYWSLPLQDSKASSAPLRQTDQLFDEPLPETTLCKQYLRTMGYPQDGSITAWWSALAELFLVIDRSSLGFFWPKYRYALEQTQTNDDCMRNMALVSAADWWHFCRQPPTCRLTVNQLRGQRTWSYLPLLNGDSPAGNPPGRRAA
jgi:hypothetical protein